MRAAIDAMDEVATQAEATNAGIQDIQAATEE
jgi:hypothetical protein